jgi:fructose-1,6-bisphosphatase/inositol monophosphatase family enzyme
MNTNELIRKLVFKAIEIIRNESNEIVATSKPAYPGKQDDYFTNADIKAQEMYVKEITEHFPGYGIIGEEAGLNIPCLISNRNIYFVIDPLDGTKAYKRGQSHGIGTMIALVEEGEVVASYVGNVNTGEIIGFSGEKHEVERSRFDYTSTLPCPPKDTPEKSYLLLDKTAWEYPKTMQLITKPKGLGGLFKSTRTLGGSIGTTVACLWTGDCEAVICEPAITPWDHVPVLGISKAMGLIYLKWNKTIGNFEEYEPEVFTKIRTLPHHIDLITSKEYAKKIIDFIAKSKLV